MGWTYKGRDASMQTLPGYGDCDPPDDEPVAGVDYSKCAWCYKFVMSDDAVICDGDDGPEHLDSCPDGIHEWALWACKACHAEGLTEFHPDEQPDEDDDLTNE